MKTYRFITATCHDVFAETLDEAIETLNERKRKGLSPKFDTVIRIEVQDEKGEYIKVDRPLRGGDLDTSKEAQVH